jgi:hypothetical protein
MKLTSILSLVLLTSTAAAWPTINSWELRIEKNDGSHAEMHGRVNSGCVNLGSDTTSPVHTAIFKEGTFADTFELYSESGCASTGRRFREGAGKFAVKPNFRVKSYNVY